MLHQRDDTNHHVRLLLHERQVLFGLMKENQEVLFRLKNAFDPLSVAKPRDSSKTPINSIDSWNDIEKISILGLAELNLNTGNVLNERLLGSKEHVPKGITEKSKEIEDHKLQLDTPAEEGLRQVSIFDGHGNIQNILSLIYRLIRYRIKIEFFHVFRLCLIYQIYRHNKKITVLEHQLQ